MQNIGDTHTQFRLCQPAAMSLTYAREEHLGIVLILGGLWGLYLCLLFNQFNQTEELESPRTLIDAGLAVVLGIGLFWGLLSRKLIAYAQQLVVNAAELANDGVLENGLIVDIWQPDADIEQGLFVAYRFEYQDCIWIGQHPVKQQPYGNLQIGDDIVVRLLPRNPRVCMLLPTQREPARKPHKLKVSAPYRTVKPRRHISLMQTVDSTPIARHS
ncbi:hypothetical protein [Methylomonas sp. MK1]|uniref:hypothetical protein n=1 Tax=Methylomonas sp. MK1 TaxID=1131552 RepID=UPI00037CA235|nr:hypothetical protein [Methylomonas sp. MK1]